MHLRALLVGLAAGLLFAARAPADQARAASAAPRREAAREAEHWSEPRPPQARFRWGIPETPFRPMEEERKLFGFHFEFEWGGVDSPARGYGVR